VPVPSARGSTWRPVAARPSAQPQQPEALCKFVARTLYKTYDCTPTEHNSFCAIALRSPAPDQSGPPTAYVHASDGVQRPACCSPAWVAVAASRYHHRLRPLSRWLRWPRLWRLEGFKARWQGCAGAAADASQRFLVNLALRSRVVCFCAIVVSFENQRVVITRRDARKLSTGGHLTSLTKPPSYLPYCPIMSFNSH
jgi:hypothetical protein